MPGAECALAQSVTGIRIGSIALLGSVLFFYFLKRIIRAGSILFYFQADGADFRRRVSVRNKQADGFRFSEFSDSRADRDRIA